MNVKESKANQNSSRDSWTALQTELGLLSSPIEQEQVSVIRAVDHQESDDFQNQEVSAEVPQDEIVPSRHESDSVTVNILMPETTEKAPEHASDPFGFDPLDDCDIPKNAFSSPRKSKAFRKTEESAPTPDDVPPQEIRETLGFALPSESESRQSEALHDGTGTSDGKPSDSIIDPLLSDELPTSLWQPRKPATVAKTPASVASPSAFSDSWSNAKVKELPVATPPSTDDLGRPSSGQKRYERGNGRQQQEKSFDRRSREPMQGPSERDWDRREHPRNVPNNPRHRQPRAADPPAAFDDFTIDDPADSPMDSSFNELAWEPKSTTKGRDRGHDDHDWLDDGVDMEMEQASPRTKQSVADRSTDNRTDRSTDNRTGRSTDNRTGRSTDNRTGRSTDNRNRKSISEKREKPEKREKFDKDARAAYEAERILARRAREEQVREEREESPARPSAAPKRSEPHPTGKPTGVPPQKIAVSSWDDAVRDIIEKNMQRRPATSGNKTDRDRRNGGRSHRR